MIDYVSPERRMQRETIAGKDGNVAVKNAVPLV